MAWHIISFNSPANLSDTIEKRWRKNAHLSWVVLLNYLHLSHDSMILVWSFGVQKQSYKYHHNYMMCVCVGQKILFKELCLVLLFVSCRWRSILFMVWKHLKHTQTDVIIFISPTDIITHNNTFNRILFSADDVGVVYTQSSLGYLKWRKNTDTHRTLDDNNCWWHLNATMWLVVRPISDFCFFRYLKACLRQCWS
jgi:hypothetical protein